ncbi:MAG: TatD family hydrolase [Eggerthellaceae bacterium]
MNLFDTHCHLDFNPASFDQLYRPSFADEAAADNPCGERFASPAENAGSGTYICREEKTCTASRIALQDAGTAEPLAESTQYLDGARIRYLCMTCSPEDFAQAKPRFADNPDVHVGCGLHPRWIADGTCSLCDVERLCALIAHERIIGEVGLDFLPAFEASRDDQLSAFDRIVNACAKTGNKVLSIHALRSADCVLDTLERHLATDNCACVLHWFSGSSDQLHRAIKAGCWFSVNNRMLDTKKGREYARIIPESRLLLESDLPSQPTENAAPEQIAASLAKTLEKLAQIRGKDCEMLCFHNAEALIEDSAL